MCVKRNARLRRCDGSEEVMNGSGILYLLAVRCARMTARATCWTESDCSSGDPANFRHPSRKGQAVH